MILTVALNPAIDKTWVAPGFAVGESARIAEVQAVPGGKGNNVARVVRALGRPVVATGFAAGHGGRWMEEALAALGVDARYWQVPGETRTCPTVIDPQAGTQTQLIEPGPPIGPADAAAFLDHYRSLLPGAAVVVMSGSLPPGLPPDYYVELIRIAAAAGVPAVLDTSGEALRRGATAGPRLIKPNQDELRDLFGRDLAAPVGPGAGGAAGAGAADVRVPGAGAADAGAADVRAPGAGAADAGLQALAAACRGVLAGGVGAVAASLGAAGALLVGPGYALRAVPPPVAAVNTVGSGDAMVAGLAVGLSEGMDPAEGLRLAVACGAANALSVGIADVGLPTVERLLPRVDVQPLPPRAGGAAAGRE